VHLVACVCFAATSMQSFLAWSFSAHPLKRCVAILVSLVNAVSTTLYGGKVLGYVTIMPTRVAGQFFLPLR
jgi:hypothetical protein